MARLSPKEFREQRRREEEKRIFERKIEEDRLGISRLKQKRVMSFKTYRILKLILLAVTGLMLFIYTPAVLPLTIIIALMLIVTKRLEKEKNKNVNKKYRIKIRATDSIIAIIMIVLTLGMTGYSLITAYINGGSLNNSSAIYQRLNDAGFNQSQISASINRRSETSSYQRIIDDAMSLMTGNRNVFKPRRMMIVKRPPNLEAGDTMQIKKRPSTFQMMRNMPLEMLFRQIFQMVCAVIVGIMILLGTINVIESFKYGEIKKITLDKRFQAPKGRNAPCPCGSGKKTKYCDCGRQ